MTTFVDYQSAAILVAAAIDNGLHDSDSLKQIIFDLTLPTAPHRFISSSVCSKTGVPSKFDDLIYVSLIDSVFCYPRMIEGRNFPHGLADRDLLVSGSAKHANYLKQALLQYVAELADETDKHWRCFVCVQEDEGVLTMSVTWTDPFKRKHGLRTVSMSVGSLW